MTSSQAYSQQEEVSLPISVQFLHSQPQRDVASLLTAQLTRCRSVAIVAGFVTPDGIEALTLTTPSHIGKLDRFVVGAGTYRAFEAIDQLIVAGAAPPVFRVHLGHSRMSGGHRNPFVRYHPMLHSKIYLFELDSGSTSAFVGSHNVTGFALRGFNGEAGVLLEGSSTDPVFNEIRSHVDGAFAQATPYDPSMKEGYAWWTREFFDGLRAEANDTPRDAEPRKTVVIVAFVQRDKIQLETMLYILKSPKSSARSDLSIQRCISTSSMLFLALPQRRYPNSI